MLISCINSEDLWLYTYEILQVHVHTLNLV